MRSGHSKRWGKRPEHNPPWSPCGPEILDVEISSGGGCPQTCSVCYKGNGKSGQGRHMSFNTFKSIFDKFPHTTTKKGKRIFFLQQLAAGITSITAHPELWEIFDYCRENGVIPNTTINGAEIISDNFLQRLVDTCGAIAVSVNENNFDRAINTIKRMTDLGAPQINIHYVLSVQNSEYLYDKLLISIKDDLRLSQLNAIVFLGLKPLKRGVNYDVLSNEEYLRLVKYCLDKQINFGFDSCGSPKVERAIQFLELSPNQKSDILAKCERCESFCFSLYINVDGLVYPCSFGENSQQSIDITKVNDFIKDVWLSREAKMWRCELFKQNRECPLFPQIRACHK